MRSAKEDTQTLVDELMPFAMRMLGEYGEFLPYGGHLKINGEIIHEGATTGEERSKSQELIDILRDAHRQQAKEGTIVAACIVYDILTAPPDRDEKQDAIAFEIDHRDSCSRIVIFPYKITEGGEVIAEAAFAVPGNFSIFPNE